MMGRALFLRFAGVLTAVATLVGISIASEEPPKRPNCTFMDLQGFAFVDDHTAVLEYGHRTGAPAPFKLWFKVTFANRCPHLKRARFVEMKTRDCPKLGDVLKFSRKPFADDDHDNDSCRINTAEEIPVGSKVLPTPG
jgi:hypothetical protein